MWSWLLFIFIPILKRIETKKKETDLPLVMSLVSNNQFKIIFIFILPDRFYPCYHGNMNTTHSRSL